MRERLIRMVDKTIIRLERTIKRMPMPTKEEIDSFDALYFLDRILQCRNHLSQKMQKEDNT